MLVCHRTYPTTANAVPLPLGKGGNARRYIAKLSFTLQSVYTNFSIFFDFFCHGIFLNKQADEEP